jgi:hypothetical protein
MARVEGYEKKGKPVKLTKKQEELIAFLDNKEEAGMGRTKQWVDMWQESLQYFFSDQLHYKKRHKDWQWVVLNYIWPTAIQEIAKISRHAPKIYARPWEETDADSAEAWQSHMQWQWEKGINKTGMRLEQIAALLDNKIFGYRVSKIYWEGNVEWDDQNKKWIGDVKHKLWHPAEFWASDEEKVDDGDCGSVRWVTLDYAIKQYPQFKDELIDKAERRREGDNAVGGYNHIRGQLGSAGTYPAAGTGGVDRGEREWRPNRLLSLILKNDVMNGSSDADQDDTLYVKLQETYFFDNETKHVKEEEDIPAEELIEAGAIVNDGVQFIDTATGEPIKAEDWPKRTIREYDQPLYPNGRYVLRSDDLILNPKEEQQVWPYSRWPFIVSTNYLLPHMWQGVDAVQLTKDTQDMINVTVSHLVNNMKMFGDPRIAVEKGAIDVPPGRQKDHYKVSSGAGAIIRLVRGGLKKMKIIDPTPPSAAATQLYSLFAQEYRNLVGMQEISIGKANSKEMSATESQILATTSNDRIALQVAFEDEWIRKVVSLIADICQRQYEPERWVRVVGPDDMDGVVQITRKEKLVKFDVNIIAGSTLPYDDEKRKQAIITAYEIMDNQFPNPMLPDVLRELEVPNWKEKLAEHQGWVQFQEFLQLFQSMIEGQVEPEEAVRILLDKAYASVGGQQALEAKASKGEEAS